MAATHLHPLTTTEIQTLEKQGCSCQSWHNVLVAEGFDPRRFRNVQFSGEVRLGAFFESTALPDGRSLTAGITNAAIHNCDIGANVYINNVRGVIANYDIGANAVIEDVGRLAVEGTSTFGNGVKVNALSEAGGRKTPIFCGLSPQLAYILVTQRHRPRLIETLLKMIDRTVKAASSSRGQIGKGAHIQHCGDICNVNIGESAQVVGAARLENGTLLSSADCPTRVGAAVIAKDFIIACGGSVHSAAIVTKSYIGSGCDVGMQFTAQDCLLFGPGLFQQGEAKSLFAGPLTTTGHKSSLLIAGMVSFFNAGSGANQSNHKYKLGALHHGVLERGCKTGSGVYMLWPTHIAPFTTILGHHPRHIDASAFPFSLLIEDDAGSRLIPAWNLGNIGLWRDEIKWRAALTNTNNSAHRLEHDILTPFTVSRLSAALAELQKMARTGSEQINGFFVKGSSVSHAIDLYEAARALYLSKALIRRFSNGNIFEKIFFLSALKPAPYHDWVDAAGMLLPAELYADLLARIESNQFPDTIDIEKELTQIHSAGNDHEWQFVMHLIAQQLDKQVEKVTAGEIAALLTDAAAKIDDLRHTVEEDGAKEFDEPCRFGFGLNGDRDRDFEAVRGTPEDNDHIKQIAQEFKTTADEALRLSETLRKL